MALTFNKSSDEPQVHALIIGVGAYHHLRNGAQAKDQEFPGVNQLNQLTSPPISAVAILENLISLNQNGNLALPLGSVEFLASEIPGSNSIPRDITNEDPTYQNIKIALDRWIKECKRNSKNIAFFYFCGHGVEDGDQILLASDFGTRPDSPFDESFNFDKTRMAINQLKIDHQLFLVDACREILPGMNTQPPTVNGFLTPNRVKRNCEFPAFFKAASPNEGAFAQPNDISFFTKAIIKGLNGAVSKKKNGKWLVTSTDLYIHIRTLMEIECEGQGDLSRCEPNCPAMFTLTKWNLPTNRLLIVDCDPEAALHVANLNCYGIDGINTHTREPAPDHWQIVTPAGYYKIHARFDGGFETVPEIISVEDPVNRETICCQEILQ